MDEFSTWLDQNKELWVRVYDEVITPKLEIEWKRRNEAHEKELSNRNEEHKIQLAQLNTELNANAHLKEENERLRKLLQAQGIDTAECIEQQEAPPPDTTVSITDFRRLTEKNNELEKRCYNSTQKIKYLERKNVAVMQKNKEMKESVRAWQEYCDRNIIKQKTKSAEKSTKEKPDALLAVPEGLEGRPSVMSSPKSTATVTPRSLASQKRSSPAPISLLTLSPPLRYVQNNSEIVPGRGNENFEDVDIALQPSDHHSSPLPEDHDGAGKATIDDHQRALFRQPGSERVTSSQTTEDETAEQNEKSPQISTENNDDNPVVVSTRSLKRKRSRSKGIKIYTDGSDGTPHKPFRVKEELHSSPPLSAIPMDLRRKETMDLDELGENVIHTPHKRSRRASVGHFLKTEKSEAERSNSAPPVETIVKEEPHPENIEKTRMVNAHTDHVQPLRETNLRMSNEIGNPRRQHGSVLQPLDSNAVMRKNESTLDRRTKRRTLRQKDKHKMITESDETPPPTDENGNQLPPHEAREHYNHRLRVLKAITTPSSKDITTAPQTAPAKVTTENSSTISTPSTSTRPSRSAHGLQKRLLASKDHGPTPSEPVPDGRPAWTLGSTSASSKKAKPLPTPKPPKPLRSKPIDELGVLDFKPNPAYNQGYSHAFSETVRRRSDRLCLPGCTSTECCGSSFRALARAAASLTSEEEDDLLREYLGDAYDSFGLTQMSEGERSEVVLQARTRQMANQHGKHRQAYERGKSPPGFWRTGFPNTQEIEADKAQTREMEKGMVRERWLEAQRKGGKWIFRDE